MEVAEQAPVSTKPSWFSRTFNHLLGRPKQAAEKLTENVSQAVPPQTAEAKPPVQEDPNLSGKPRREAKKEAYLEWKQTAAKQPEKVATQVESSVSPIVTPSEKKVGMEKRIRKEDLPWLDQQEVRVSLGKISLPGGISFFYGDMVYGKKLTEAKSQLDEHRKRIADNLLFSHLPGFVRDGYHPYIKQVDGRVTHRPIYNVYNKGGQRVYFMRFDTLQGIPVIIRIAVCDKAREDEVLSVITSRSHKVIKQKSRL